MKFKELVLLAENNDEDILAGMQAYEDLQKPVHCVAVNRYTPRTATVTLFTTTKDKVISYYYINLEDAKKLETDGWVSTDGNEFCMRFDRISLFNWWFMSYNKDQVKMVTDRIKSDAKKNDVSLDMMIDR